MKTLIRDGLIIDGSGRKPFHGSLLIEHGKIAAVYEGEDPLFSLRADETKKLLENAVSAAFLSAQEKKSLLALEHEKNQRISQKSDCFLV